MKIGLGMIPIEEQRKVYFINYIHNELYRAQSLTSLKADLCQDINKGFAFIRFLN